MYNDLKIHTYIKRVSDGKIKVKPKRPLTKRQKDLIKERSFNWFPYYYTKRVLAHSLMEYTEQSEYKYNKNLLWGESFLFFSREMERFDLSKVEAFKDKKNPAIEPLTRLFVSYLKINLEFMLRRVKNRHLLKIKRTTPEIAEDEEIVNIDFDLIAIVENLELDSKSVELEEVLNEYHPMLYEYFFKKHLLGFPRKWLLLSFDNTKEMEDLIKGYKYGK
jgi:hypothetical protein